LGGGKGKERVISPTVRWTGEGRTGWDNKITQPTHPNWIYDRKKKSQVDAFFEIRKDVVGKLESHGLGTG